MSISGDKDLNVKLKHDKSLIEKGLTNVTELKLLGFHSTEGKCKYINNFKIKNGIILDQIVLKNIDFT